MADIIVPGGMTWNFTASMLMSTSHTASAGLTLVDGDRYRVVIDGVDLGGVWEAAQTVSGVPGAIGFNQTVKQFRIHDTDANGQDFTAALSAYNGQTIASMTWAEAPAAPSGKLLIGGAVPVAIKYGTSDVAAVYAGAVKVWPAASVGPTAPLIVAVKGSPTLGPGECKVFDRSGLFQVVFNRQAADGHDITAELDAFDGWRVRITTPAGTAESIENIGIETASTFLYPGLTWTDAHDPAFELAGHTAIGDQLTIEGIV